MTKTSKAFTLAEVLTTLMVIGVVAAMTIPTLMTSTEDQQKKVALKKAVSVLGQGTQLLVAKEEECGTISSSAALAACMNRVIAGSIGGTDNNEITTADGMVYKFYIGGNTAGTSIAQACGLNFNNTTNGWLGKGNCGVVVDVNGFSKGTKGFTAADAGVTNYTPPAFNASGFTATTGTSDQFALSLSAAGARPIHRAANTETGATLDSLGYSYIFGGDAKTVQPSSSGTDCKKNSGTTEAPSWQYGYVAAGSTCDSLGAGWVVDNGN